jgi:hypothetical protein
VYHHTQRFLGLTLFIVDLALSHTHTRRALSLFIRYFGTLLTVMGTVLTVEFSTDHSAPKGTVEDLIDLWCVLWCTHTLCARTWCAGKASATVL